jgi:hypothetical protein
MMNGLIAKRLASAISLIAALISLFAGAAAQAADESVVPIMPAQKEMTAPVEASPPQPPVQAEQSQSPDASPPPQAGEVQERGFPPTAIAPGTVQGTLQSKYLAPTPSLTLVANALQLTFPNSLTIDLRVPGNLPVTVPVEITVLYSTSSQRRTQTYAPATGTLIHYEDDESNGLPRPMRLDINFRELVPNGQSFHFSRQVTLTPLYDITVSGLRFFLFADCDTVGKSDITFEWESPDNKFKSMKFKLKGGETKHIEEFIWQAHHVSLANLVEPIMRFDERDLGFGYGFSPLPASGRRLTPQTPKQFNFTLLEGDIGPSNPGPSTKCKARITYGISRTLR